MLRSGGGISRDCLGSGLVNPDWIEHERNRTQGAKVPGRGIALMVGVLIFAGLPEAIGSGARGERRAFVRAHVAARPGWPVPAPHWVRGLGRAAGTLMADVRASSETDFRAGTPRYDYLHLEGGISHPRPGTSGVVAVHPCDGTLLQAGPGVAIATTRYQAELEDGTTLYGATYEPQFLPEQRGDIPGIHLLRGGVGRAGVHRPLPVVARPVIGGAARARHGPRAAAIRGGCARLNRETTHGPAGVRPGRLRRGPGSVHP